MEKLLFGLAVMVIGMVTVFIGLIILIAIIHIISKIINSAQKPNQDDGDARKAPVQSAAPAAKPNIVESKVAQAAPVQDQGQLIAVIAAALTAFQDGGKRMIVRAVRRVGQRSAWAEAGRREQLML